MDLKRKCGSCRRPALEKSRDTLETARLRRENPLKLGPDGEARKDRVPYRLVFNHAWRLARHGAFRTTPLSRCRWTLRVSGVKRLSLLTFFGAAKKVSAAPHRGQ